MSDSPINLMTHGHTSSFTNDLQRKNHLLKEQLNLLLSTLTQKKEENLKYLKEIDNQ